MDIIKSINSFFTKKQTLFVGLFLVALALAILWLGVISKTEANRQRGGFLNQDFRSQSPTAGNILYALFGDGSTGSTAYTRNRTSSCIPTNGPFYLSSGLYFGGPLGSNTIYILQSGNYALNNNITTAAGNHCIALIGEGDVTINKSISINDSQNIIIDNIKIATTVANAFQITNSSDVSLNDVQAYSNTANGVTATSSSFINISNAQFYNNAKRGIFLVNSTNSNINNTLTYNNGDHGIRFDNNANQNTINNSQSFNNGNIGILIQGSEENFIHNSMSYNNAQYGIYINPSLTTGINYINNFATYNNNTGIRMANGTGNLYGTISSFGNTSANTGGAGIFNVNPGSIPSLSWNPAGSIDTSNPGFNYDRVTNPENGSNQWLMNPITFPSPPQGQQAFNVAQRPIRYIFGLKIDRQLMPVSYSPSGPIEYGNDQEDYNSTKYIAELDSTLPPAQQTIVNQYFGSGSVYTVNRLTNSCSLSAFQVVNLTGGNFTSPISLLDHTIYILTGGSNEYRYNGIPSITNFFTFNGNCIAVIGNGNTRITKSNTVTNMFYANGKHNLIIDSIKTDGKYYDSPPSSSATITMGIKFDGTTNNSTINNIQTFNDTQYGIYFGVGSHHNTIMNSQLFNNGIAGIHFYYSSDYNVINNTQTYNNSGYGIWFANGSIRNTMNNFQSYNNSVGVFGDMTTKNNVINNALIYNNSDAGIYFKNSSGNVLNHVGVYNNKIGIRTLYNSSNNVYESGLSMFGNRAGDFDGTNGNDGYLALGNGSFLGYQGALITGSTSMSCSYATNPTLSGNGLTLLTGNCANTGSSLGFASPYDTDVQYTFGLNIYKQVVPVRYNMANTFDLIPSQYDPTKYIAEIFPIRDTTPENVSFSSSGNYQLNTAYTTNVYTAQVINTIVTGYLILLPASTSGHLIINGINVGMTGTINNGDLIQVWLMSSTGFNQTITGTVTIGIAAPAPFTLTTRGPSQLPITGSFAFNNITGVNPSTLVYTNTGTINGIETGVFAGINFTPATSGRLEVYSGSAFVYSGFTGVLVFNGNKIKAVMISSSQYNDMITGVISIGLGTGSFYILTTPDIYPPIISFLDDVNPGYRTDTINLYFSGANAISGYTFVSSPAGCTSGMSTTGLINYTTGLVISGHSYNGEYLCAYAEDLGNNITTALSATGFALADLYFADPVEIGPVAYDLISIGYTNTSHNRYALITSATGCTAGVTLNNYTGSLLITTTSSNGKYVCAYAEDVSNNPRFLVSAHPINIDPNMPSIHFTDDVSDHAVLTDTIAVAFSGGSFLDKLYKFVNSSSDCDSGGTINYTGPITINNEGYNGEYFCVRADDTLGHQMMLTSQYPLDIDRTAPSTPVITYPLNNEELFFIDFEFSGATDTGSGIFGYNYQIADDQQFLDIFNSGFVETTGSSISPIDFGETQNKYYRRIQAVDNVGLTSARSQTGSFTATDNTDFFFNDVTDASINTYYDSDDITIDGLGTNDEVWATVNKGSITKNGHDKGMSTPVQNNDVISINLKSSKHYDTSVTSTLTVANRNADFTITTVQAAGECTLSDDDKGKIQIVFNSLVGQYSGDQSKYDEFLTTMKSMLQDQIDLTNNCNLQYLSDLLNGTIIGNITVDTGSYIAPNCKQYRIGYDNDLLAYTSPDFRSAIYFADRYSITRYIDSKNPGDCHISNSSTSSVSSSYANTDPSKHIAPNGKLYRILNDANGYTSKDFSAPKYFSSLSNLTSYLDKNNPPLQIWNHTVDTSFQPMIYDAPNGKSYTIYKTDRGYMSYKLLNVRYYSSLQDIESYINKNNPK